MKTLKNDTRYIIKKVIIGVLIAIVLFNARKCGVYAETIELSNISASNRCSPVNLIYTYDIGGNSRWSCASTSFQVSRTLSYSNTTLFYDTYNIKNYVNVGNSTYNIKYFILYDTTNNYYIIQNTNINNYSTNTLIFNSVNNYIDLHFGDTGSLVPSTIISNHSMTFTNDNNTYTLSNYNNEIYSYNLSKISLSDLDLSHTYIYDTNIEGLSLIIDNQLIQEYPTFPPSGYQELSLKDYQGVVFVPKNYDDINCDLTSSGLCETFFEYYYQEEIKESYISLDNHFKVTLNSEILNSPSEPTGRVSEFPIYQLDENQNKIYNAFLIYNFTNDGTPLDPKNYYAYGSAKVWYDSTLWNYYLVEDFSTWSQQICFYVGNDEICTNILGLPTLREAIEEADTQNLIDSFSPTSSNVILEFLKFPFNFLNSLSPDRCTSFDIPFPHIGSIRIYCLSDTFQEVLGDSYNIIAIIINGFLIYNFTLMNIKTLKTACDPDNTKLEVVDL